MIADFMRKPSCISWQIHYTSGSLQSPYAFIAALT